MPLIAQVSDTHFDSTAAIAARNDAVWDYLDGLEPDLVLVTGDVTDHGTADEYAEAARRLSGRHRVAVIPGNHDSRAEFAAAFRPGVAHTGAEPLNLAIDVAGLSVLALDSTIPSPPDSRIDAGHLDDATLAWLDAALAASAQPTLVALHHPPVDIGNPVMDAIKLDNPDALAEVLNRHDSVAGIVCGHAHSAISTRFAGLPLIVAPAVASTITGEKPSGELLNRDLPVGFALHTVDAAGALQTTFRHLGLP